MKTDVSMSLGILRTGKESFHHWKKSMEFKKGSIGKSDQELKSVYESIKKIMEKIYVYLKDLHTEFQVASNG